MKINKKVFINSFTSINCSGKNSSELFENICTSKSSIKKDDTLFEGQSPAIGIIESPNNFFDNLIKQCEYILKNSSVSDFSNTILIIGSSVGGMTITEDIYFKDANYKNIDSKLHYIDAISHILKEKFTFYDDISFSTACTSSANALGYAYEVLSKGIYKNALVVGVDSISKTTVGGFLSLGVLSSENARPFDKDRTGMNVSEAIACLFLETQKRDNSVELCGVGYSSDAHHMTHPHPDGEGAILSMKRALVCAKLENTQIDYVNAHGTGTLANDDAEAKAIQTLFPNNPYVSSTKSITGHTLGAAGAIEAIISCISIQNGIVPKNNFLENVNNESINLIKENIQQDINYVISNSFAFGGNNCSLIFGKVK